MNAVRTVIRGRSVIAATTVVSMAVCNAQYQGTGSVTQGIATTTIDTLYSCPNGRVPVMGTVVASDNTTWTVPAAVHFADASFPFASVLYNPCTGATFNSANEALATLDGSDVVVIDPGGDLVTAFVFADNYFEMLINGTPVGKDDVPYTQFNSNIIRFKVHRPFTVAMLLVDWEENLGLGTEVNGGFTHHAGDGGLVAVFQDEQGDIITTTGPDWKAQVFYTSPIMDLSCPQEIGPQRISNGCSTQDSNDGSAYYGLHWPVPSSWADISFDDGTWPQASTFANDVVGVDNKPAYTNFTDVFDDPEHDASFIWSTNLVLDNAVIVRHVVQGPSAISGSSDTGRPFRFIPMDAYGHFTLDLANGFGSEDIRNIRINDCSGRTLSFKAGPTADLDLSGLAPDMYLLVIDHIGGRSTQKIHLQ